ncbi:MAG: F0F1 ATP synthase subunit delta [Proteobacteria bacterium]|nr:MAG: F0F1 ATP synthase subunit delta [Pseudomonadota bacterium]
MAERSTIARPYAKAAFAYAREKGVLRPWSEALGIASLVVSDPQVERLLGNPRVTPRQLADLIADVCGSKLDAPLDEAARAFIDVLAESRRLALLPEIATMFEAMLAEEENVADVAVTSAAPLDETQQRELAESLRKRFGREVRLHLTVDPALLGGAIIRSGDLVIDGSLKTRLDQLAAAMTH